MIAGLFFKKGEKTSNRENEIYKKISYLLFKWKGEDNIYSIKVKLKIILLTEGYTEKEIKKALNKIF